MAHLAAVLAAVLAVAGPAPAPPGVVAVAAAANVRAALDEVVAEFERRNPGVQVRVSYGASASLYAQILQGAPFDLFYSADELHPGRLVEAGAAEASTYTRYARGQLVLWLPRGSPVSPGAGVAKLADPRIRRIAIANPAHAPYGVAAEAALRAAGVLDRVRDRLVLGEDAAQAAQFAQSGNTDAALLPLSLALLPAMRRAGAYAVLPEALYPRLDQAAVVTRRGRDSAAARALLRFTVGPEARAILQRWGYATPGA